MTGSKASAKETLFSAEQLQIGFNGRVLFKGLSLSASVGEVICLLGPSGSGKSTLLRALAGLQSIEGGEIRWNTPSQQRPKCGFVFQDAELLPWRSTLENARLPLELDKGPASPSSASERNAAASKALALVHLNEAQSLYPHELSGGMRMRVSLARALVTEPRVLFMDEPFAALDETARFRLQTEVRKLSEQQNITVLFVTHSTYEAVFLADRIVTLGGFNTNSPGDKPDSLGESKIVSEQKIEFSLPRATALRSSSEYLSAVTKISESNPHDI